jgi:hypothetical protein
MFGSFLPSLGCLAAIKSTQVEGADIVMKSSGLRDRRFTGVTRSGRQTSDNQTRDNLREGGLADRLLLRITYGMAILMNCRKAINFRLDGNWSVTLAYEAKSSR